MRYLSRRMTDIKKYLLAGAIAILAVMAWNKFVAPKTGLPSA